MQKKYRLCGKIVRIVDWSDKTTDKIWDRNDYLPQSCSKYYNKMIAASITRWKEFATYLGTVINSLLNITPRMTTYAMSVISFTKAWHEKGYPNLMRTVVKFTALSSSK